VEFKPLVLAISVKVLWLDWVPMVVLVWQVLLVRGLLALLARALLGGLVQLLPVL
jgi:hypothetical protein